MIVDQNGVCLESVYMRTPYSYDRKAASDETALVCADVSRAQQQFKEECDINTIVRRFGLTGELPKDVAMPESGDFTDVVDYKTAMDMIRKADEAFMQMPSAVRDRFQNDPQRFLEFSSDPNNYDEARKLGLLKPPREAPKPVEVRVIPDKPA